MVHLKYPSMERQDLTQSQLGSFKFIPVDEVAPSFHPHPLLLQQYHQVSRNGHFSQVNPSPDITHDPAFFNQQIKPSLDNSRLRLGPATVRAAVEGASTSPQKRFGQRAQRAAMRPDAQAFNPQFHGSENDSIPSMYTSEGNSDPTSLMMSDSSNGLPLDFRSAHSSVLRALESEQAAHENTKAQLEQEIISRREAEAETGRLAECNKGLVNSINLLKSTVRHMVQKESDPIPDKAAVDRAMKEYHRDAQTKKPTESILYDVLANYNTTQTTLQNGQETVTTFNLDLLNTPDQNDKSEKAQLQRTLRKQMGISSDTDRVKRAHDEYQQKIESIVRNGGPLLPDFADTAEPEKLVAQVPVEQPPRTPAKIAEDPSNIMLELPASFLSKYSKQKIDEEHVDLPPIDTPHKTNLTSIHAIKPRHYDLDGNVKPKPSKIIWMPDTPIINWKIDNRHRDELLGKRSLIQTRTSDSHFVDYPLRFIPNVRDDNLYRTVMIDFIPFGTPYSDVLQQIKGGTLESIQLYGPIGDVTDFVTARVIYTNENGATAMYRRGQDPGIKINDHQVRVWQVLEATYPKNKELEEAVYVHGHTRILVIHAPIDNINEVLKQKLRGQIEAGLVLDIGRTHDGVPMVEFTSIDQSTKALKAFLDDRDLAGADFDFDEDYCNSRFPGEEDET